MEKLIMMMQRPERLEERFGGNQLDKLGDIGEDGLLHNGSSLLNGTSNMEFADADSISQSSSQTSKNQNLDPRERKLNEKIEFAKIVSKHRHVLFGDCDGIDITPRTKEEAWKKVQAEVEAAGLESYKGKPWSRLRDHDWQYVRRHAMSRSEGLHKPTGRLGDLDRIVLDIVFSTTQGTGAASTQHAQHIHQLIAAATNSNEEAMVTTNGSNEVERMLFQIIDPKNHPEPSLNEKDEYDKNPIRLVKSEIHDTSGNCGLEEEEEETEQNDAIANGDIVPVSVPNLVTTTDPGKDLLEMLTQQANAANNHQTDSFASYPSAALLFNSRQSVDRRSSITPPTALSTSSIPIAKSPSSLSSGQPASKRQRLDETCSSIQKKKEALELKRLELEVRHWEMKNDVLMAQWKLTNEKLEKEIKFIEDSEARAKEKHELEMRKLRSGQNGRI